MNFWFLCGLHAEERCIWGPLTVHERCESQIRQLLLAPIGNGRLGRTFHRHVTRVRFEIVDRESLDKSAALHAPDGGTPSVHRKRLCDFCTKPPCCIPPEIVTVITTVDFLLVIESVNWDRITSIRFPKEHPGEGQGDVSGVFRLTERPPFGVLSRIENLGQIGADAEEEEKSDG